MYERFRNSSRQDITVNAFSNIPIFLYMHLSIFGPAKCQAFYFLGHFTKQHIPHLGTVNLRAVQFGNQKMAERLLYIIYFEVVIHWQPTKIASHLLYERQEVDVLLVHPGVCGAGHQRRVVVHGHARLQEVDDAAGVGGHLAVVGLHRGDLRNKN